MKYLMNKLAVSNGLSVEETKDMMLSLASLVGFMVLTWAVLWVYYG